MDGIYKRLLKQGKLRKRNEMTYEAGFLLAPSESEKAFKDAIRLLKGILKEVKAQNPQLELKFDL